MDLAHDSLPVGNEAKVGVVCIYLAVYALGLEL